LAATARCNASLQRHPLELRLDAASQPKQFDMEVRFFAPVPTQMAWQAMTDYDAMAGYMPGMERSEVIAADGDSLRVLQTGSGGISPFRVTLSSTLDITLHGHVATWFTTRGNLDSQGRAEVQPQAGGSAVRYTASLQPRIWLPPLLGLWFMRDRLQQQMTALRQRMCMLLGEAKVQWGNGGIDR
jgi:carbon monoxide dehydrogenase subunit G